MRVAVQCILATTLWWSFSAAPLGVAVETAEFRESAASSGEGHGEPVMQRRREGTELVDELGEFQAAGERIHFRSANGRLKVTVLENLALERISRVLDETRTPPLFSVSGTLTEYHGGNYLLVTRAVVKARLPQ